MDNSWWQNLPVNFDPVAFSIGPLDVRWYGLMYIVAFVIVYILVHYRIKHEKLTGLPAKSELKILVDDMLTWALIGVLVGGRFGYVLFYNFSGFLRNPLTIIWPFDQAGNFIGIAGMSFHGGLLGVAVAAILFCRAKKLNLWRFAELFMPAIPLGYTFGRIGNWLNGELWGRTTDSAIGQYFAQAPGEGLRHPSQLYEAFGEGLLLFLILWPLRNKFKPGVITGMFIAGYGLVRFAIEYFREPDAHLGFIFAQLSMGQILSLLMVLVGGALIYTQRKG